MSLSRAEAVGPIPRAPGSWRAGGGGDATRCDESTEPASAHVLLQDAARALLSARRARARASRLLPLLASSSLIHPLPPEPLRFVMTRSMESSLSVDSARNPKALGLLERACLPGGGGMLRRWRACCEWCAVVNMQTGVSLYQPRPPTKRARCRYAFKCVETATNEHGDSTLV